MAEKTGKLTSPSNPTVCQGGSVQLCASGANSYQWSTASSSSCITINSGGSYSVTGTNSGCTGTESTYVSQLPTPDVSILPINPTFCAGESVQIIASGANSYQWSTGSTSSSITVSNQGTYSVTGTSSGCADDASIYVTQSQSLNISINPSNPTINPGESIQLCASGADSYQWSNGSSNQCITVSDGTYSVTGTSGSCSGTASTGVTVDIEEITSIIHLNVFPNPNADTFHAFNGTHPS